MEIRMGARFIRDIRLIGDELIGIGACGSA